MTGISIRRSFPFLALTGALIILGSLVYHRVTLSQQTPYWDAGSYVHKARSFWAAVDEGRWVNPLDVPPTVRPPGTILMSYPFGFSDHLHGFYFRSIFIPLVLFILSLWIVGRPMIPGPKMNWSLVALCLAFSTLPLFFQFEPTDNFSCPVVWGLVDNFLAAVAALSAALILRGTRGGTRIYIFTGIVASAFCLLIKPAGIIVMALVMFVWGVNAHPHILTSPALVFRDKKSLPNLLFGLSAFIITYGLTVWLAYSSRYYCPQNMELGHSAVGILRDTFSRLSWRFVLENQLHPSFGLHWLVLLAVAWTGSFWCEKTMLREAGEYLRLRTRADAVSIIVVLSVGVWFWIFYTGGTVIRYFYPFVFIAIILSFPRVVLSWTSVGRIWKRIAAGVLLAPFFIMLFLLHSSDPSLFLQHLLGVNLTSGSQRWEMEQARSLIERAKTQGRNLQVYCHPSSSGCACGLFASAGYYESIRKPDAPTIMTVYPVEWDRSPTLRFSRIAPCDYVLFEPVSSSIQAHNILNFTKSVPDYHAEVALLQAWLTIAGEDSGLLPESETSMRLVRVADPRKFSNALEILKTRYHWNETFRNANPTKWVDGKTYTDLMRKADKSYQNIRFGNESAFLLLGIIPYKTEQESRLELLWKSLDSQRLRYTTIVDLLDSNGKILCRQELLQDAAKRMVDAGTVWRDVAEIPLGSFYRTETASLGVMVYEPPDGFLPVNHESTDANGFRLLIPFQMEHPPHE